MTSFNPLFSGLTLKEGPYGLRTGRRDGFNPLFSGLTLKVTLALDRFRLHIRRFQSPIFGADAQSPEACGDGGDAEVSIPYFRG